MTKSLKNQLYLTVKDHSVSEETFQLILNEELQMLETYPQPAPEKLSAYYESEDYISHTDAKRNLFEKVYHLVKSIALKNKLKLINSLAGEHKNLLDVGCGTGDFLQIAQEHKWNVYGIEPNEQARDIANQKTNNSVGDVKALMNFENGNFDIITLWHVLEHLPNLEEQISLYSKLLKPNGKLIIAVPNHKSYDATYYKEFWAAYDVPRHLWHFSRTSISKLAAPFGLGVIQTLPMKFDAFYVSMLSEKYKWGKMNVLRAFWIGLRSNLKANRSGEYSSIIYILKKAKI